MKRNIALEIGPMMSSECRHILYYAMLATYYNNQSRMVNLRRTTETLIGNTPRKRMAHKTRAGRRITGEEDRS